MATSKSVYVIHAGDGALHLNSLTNILKELINENRISNYFIFERDAIGEGSFKDLGSKDMVIILLSNDIANERDALTDILLELKERLPESKIVEILVDNIPYEVQFITFPKDFEPVRTRTDMDKVWKGIGASLRDMFPSPVDPGSIPPPPSPSSWKKWALYAIGAIAAVLVIYYTIMSGSNTDDGVPPVGQMVTDLNAVVESPDSFSGDCPHTFNFVASITVDRPGNIVYTWLRSDNATAEELTLKFTEAGTQNVTTSWVLGGDGQTYSEFWQQLKIISPQSMVSNKAFFTLECEITVAGDWNYKMSSASGSVFIGSLQLSQSGEAVRGKFYLDGNQTPVSGSFANKLLALRRDTGLETIQIFQLSASQANHLSGTYYNEGTWADSGTVEFYK